MIELDKGTIIGMNLNATCGCGGKMVPHPRKPMVWICDRSHWWNRKRGHAYLLVELGAKYE